MKTYQILVAPQAFKGTLSARDVAAALASGIQRVHGVGAVECPVADGGDGTLDVIIGAGATRHVLPVQGPLPGQTVEAAWAMLQDGRTAVVELAQASGLRLVPVDRRNPLNTTTFGTGQLVRHALERGAQGVTITVGGSATTDGGAGLLEALGCRFLNAEGQPLPRGGGYLERLASIDTGSLHPALSRSDITVATDVDNPLVGPEGAAPVFAPQKGATPADVAVLERGLNRLADVIEAQFGRRVHSLPGAGAAGGTAGGVVGVLGARIVSGFEQVAQAVGLDDRIRACDLVITGEGQLDSQSQRGKTPVAVARRARAIGKPCVAIVGNWVRDESGVPDPFEVVLVARSSSGLADEASLADTAEAAVGLVLLGTRVRRR